VTTYHWPMRWMRWALILLGLAVLLAVPADAVALVLAPPGHAGTNQYVEVIPTSAGNAAPPGSVSGSGTATAGPQALADLGRGASADAHLAKLGKDGQAAAALAASTAPAPVLRAGGRHGSDRSANPAGSASGGVTDVLTGSDAGGLGLLLPLMLATALVVVLGIGAMRVRRRAGQTRPGI